MHSNDNTPLEPTTPETAKAVTYCKTLLYSSDYHHFLPSVASNKPYRYSSDRRKDSARQFENMATETININPTEKHATLDFHHSRTLKTRVRLRRVKSQPQNKPADGGDSRDYEGDRDASNTTAGERQQIEKSSSSGGSMFLGDKRQKKIFFNQFSAKPLEVIQVGTEDIPEPSTEKDVIIKVSSSTVSLHDCMVRKGVSFEAEDFPITPGVDVVGNIVKCGNKVRSFYVGDRVAALVRFGGNARYICVSEDDLVEVPWSCESAEAVCMVSTYMTAYQALRMVTNDNFSLNGKRILITGGIEPVGQALVQLCLRANAGEVYATAPEFRHRYVKSVLGVNPLPLDPNDWLPIIKGKMDIVFDATCQDDFSSSYSALQRNGTLICLGMSALLSRETPGFFGAPISAYWARLKGNLLPNTKFYDLWESFTANKSAFKVSNAISGC
jgi:NADPH:quinone reductase-like Zn-dependent oxidoreductase